MEDKKIGHYKYKSIINKSELTDVEKRQIKKYQTDRGLSPEQKSRVAKYFDSIQDKKVELPEYADASLSGLYSLFVKFYYMENNNNFFDSDANNGEAKILVYTLLSYFFKNEKFYDSPLLNQTISKPDLNKGLLVVGGTGCGKTSTFKAIYKMLFKLCTTPVKFILDVKGDLQPTTRYKPLFGFSTCNDVVSEYEGLNTAEEKKNFWNKYTKGTRYFDDLTTEREASNYGKVNLFQEMFEKRSIDLPKTIATMNYHDQSGSLKQTLDYLGEKYGFRVHDRLFQMFNIIELKGTSLRK
jgi:DNA replication protein DnaC